MGTPCVGILPTCILQGATGVGFGWSFAFFLDLILLTGDGIAVDVAIPSSQKSCIADSWGCRTSNRKPQIPNTHTLESRALQLKPKYRLRMAG